jgi:hypothetical protein
VSGRPDRGASLPKENSRPGKLDGRSDGAALVGAYNHAGADQLAALLGPDAAAAGEDPRRPDVRVVAGPPTMAVLPSPGSATDVPCALLSTASVPTSLLPRWVHTPPLRVKTHAAPITTEGPLLSLGPPTIAALPSPDSATDEPCWARPIAPVPTSLLPCWVQTPLLRGVFRGRPAVCWLIAAPAFGHKMTATFLLS